MGVYEVALGSSLQFHGWLHYRLKELTTAARVRATSSLLLSLLSLLSPLPVSKDLRSKLLCYLILSIRLTLLFFCSIFFSHTLFRFVHFNDFVFLPQLVVGIPAGQAIV